MAETKVTSVAKYTVEQLAKSRKYESKRDVLHAVLESNKTYSHAEVEKAIETFNKRDLSKGVKK